MRAGDGVRPPDDLEAWRGARPLERGDRERNRLLHRREARLVVVPDALVFRPVLEVVPEDEPALRIEVRPALRHQPQYFVRREHAVLDLRAAASVAAFMLSALCACTRVRRPRLFASPHIASSCSWDSVGAPPSRMLCDAKILMKSAPSAFRRRTISRSVSGVRRGLLIGCSDVRILGPGIAPDAM